MYYPSSIILVSSQVVGYKGKKGQVILVTPAQLTFPFVELFLNRCIFQDLIVIAIKAGPNILLSPNIFYLSKLSSLFFFSFWDLKMWKANVNPFPSLFDYIFSGHLFLILFSFSDQQLSLSKFLFFWSYNFYITGFICCSGKCTWSWSFSTPYFVFCIHNLKWAVIVIQAMSKVLLLRQTCTTAAVRRNKENCNILRFSFPHLRLAI